MAQTTATHHTYRDDVQPNPRGEQFGRLIRDYRDRAGLTQEQLEAASGVSRSTIARWERGDANNPNPDQVRAVCQRLGIDPRRAAIALGYLTDDELHTAAGGPQLNPTQEEVVEILADPRLDPNDIAKWVDYLRYLRTQTRRPNGREAI